MSDRGAFAAPGAGRRAPSGRWSPTRWPRDVRDPAGRIRDRDGVQVTNDLSHATVMVSVPGDEAEKTRALEGLQSAAGFLRSESRAGAHHPHRAELHFELDRGRGARGADRELLACDSPGGAGLIGALLVDKPAGLTSHDAVQRVRRALRTEAVGHTGTLDPFATGLLVVLVGRATRLARFVEAAGQDLPATVRLGVRTDTDDLTGAVVEERPVGSVSLERGAGRRWPGSRESSGSGRPATPPSTSDGVRSYRLARRGRSGGAAARRP